MSAATPCVCVFYVPWCSAESWLNQASLSQAGLHHCCGMPYCLTVGYFWLPHCLLTNSKWVSFVAYHYLLSWRYAVRGRVNFLNELRDGSDVILVSVWDVCCRPSCYPDLHSSVLTVLTWSRSGWPHTPMSNRTVSLSFYCPLPHDWHVGDVHDWRDVDSLLRDSGSSTTVRR